MGVISGLLTWPLAPVRGVVWVAEQVQAEAERQWNDPQAIARELDELDRARSAGQVSEEEADRREELLVTRLLEVGGHG